MRTLTTFLLLAVVAGPASAQQVLHEQFNFSSTFVFPPAGWEEVNHNAGPNRGWEDPRVNWVSENLIGRDSAGHDNFGPGVTNDFSLRTPILDLTKHRHPRLVFDQSLGYAKTMAHFPDGFGDGVSTIEASTDGVTWTEVWRETRTVDGRDNAIEVPIDFFAGVSGARLAFHYYGTYAHSWVTPFLEVSGVCPGFAGMHLSNLTPLGQVYIGWGIEPGPYLIPAGPCSDKIIPLVNPVLISLRTADQSGCVFLKAVVPAVACGQVSIVGFDVVCCMPTNVVML